MIGETDTFMHVKWVALIVVVRSKGAADQLQSPGSQRAAIRIRWFSVLGVIGLRASINLEALSKYGDER
jgi:hypothetical protein